MKIRLFLILGLLFVLAFGGVKIACAQGEAARSTAGTEVINSGYSLPEWHQNGQETFIWRGAYGIIKQGVSRLAVEPVGNLPIPVLFGITPANLARNFGDARGAGRRHEGLDIVAPKGAPIVSPTPAVVLSAGSGAGSGYYATTANPGGETFVYMHLDRPAALAPGQVLQTGDLIGYVGNTGNAAGGGAHLHFEIRKNGATNPYPRLKTEFTPAQKISFLEKILTVCSNRNELEKFLASAYPADFAAAKAASLALPPAMGAEMAPAKMTVAQIKAKIAQIQTLILSLQKQLLELQSQAA